MGHVSATQLAQPLCQQIQHDLHLTLAERLAWWWPLPSWWLASFTLYSSIARAPKSSFPPESIRGIEPTWAPMRAEDSTIVNGKWGEGVNAACARIIFLCFQCWCCWDEKLVLVGFDEGIDYMGLGIALLKLGYCSVKIRAGPSFEMLRCYSWWIRCIEVHIVTWLPWQTPYLGFA